MDDFVLPFHSSKASLATVGSKGANLSQLARAGFPVPSGFLISTAAYLAFVQDNDLQQQIVALTGSGAATDFEAVSAAIRQLFERESIPSQVATAIQQAVKRCWSSLWTPRALAYRASLRIDPATVSLAVVVQVLVFADVAGILFTANPLTGARDEIVIDAAWGLGEAIVSGLVTPDHLIADKATGTIKQVVVADKTVMTAPTSTGTTETVTAEAQSGLRNA